jgi:uncharacterized protein
MTMPIAEQLVLLAELAELDHKAKQNADRQESLPAAAKKADTDTAKLKAELDTALNKKHQSEQAKKAAETEAQDERHKIRKWEARANEIRGEREATALNSEIGGAKRAIRNLEDKILEHMELIEGLDKDIKKLTTQHDNTAQTATEEWEKVRSDLDALKSEAGAFAAARAGLLAKLPAPLVKRYDTIAAKRLGVGVAVINTKDICSACHRAVPPQLCIQVQKGLVIEGCPACNRLLVHHSVQQANNDATAAES